MPYSWIKGSYRIVELPDFNGEPIRGYVYFGDFGIPTAAIQMQKKHWLTRKLKWKTVDETYIWKHEDLPFDEQVSIAFELLLDLKQEKIDRNAEWDNYFDPS